MRRIVTLIAELLVVLASIYSADYIQNYIEIIPDWLIHLPDVNYSRDDFYTVLRYVLVTYTVLILIGQLLLKQLDFSVAKRTVEEIFLFAMAFAISSMAIFVTTNVSFDPQFMVGIALCSTILLILIYFVLRTSYGFINNLKSFSGALLRRLLSLPGILILLLALSPGILAKLFVSNRDIANAITQIRIYMTKQDELPWKFVNALPDYRFTQPIALQFAPGDQSTLYILQRGGQLYSVPWNKKGEKELLLDISDKVGYVEMENGALGFDFHPEYGITNHFVYLYYTAVHGDLQKNHLVRFDLSESTVDEREQTELELITWNRNNSGFHNGGSVEFGPDGFLYLSVGEMTETKSHQRLDRTLTGGILRIDIDKKGGNISKPVDRQPAKGATDNYYIPTDNPLVKTDLLEEYWAWGLRNPFRFSFDKKTGTLWAGDVGSTVWEEVNRIEKGKNYQFPYIEGREPTGEPKPDIVVGKEQPPVYTYKHTAYDRAVIGGLVYRGDHLKGLEGKYLFGDNYSGKVFILPSTEKKVDHVKIIAQAPQYAQRGMTSFTLTPDGEVLLTTLGKLTEATGLILKLVPASQESDSSLLDTTENEKLSEEDAYNIFRTNCSRCHGPEGRGNGPDAPLLGIPLPDFTSDKFQSSRNDDHLRTVISEGGMAKGLSPLMPPWGLVLTNAEVDAMIATVRGFRQAK